LSALAFRAFLLGGTAEAFQVNCQVRTSARKGEKTF